MSITTPSTKQAVGRTFIVSICVLGFVAVAQVGAVGWVFVSRAREAKPPVQIAKVTPASQLPALASLNRPFKPSLSNSEAETEGLNLSDPFADVPGKSTSPILPPLKPQPVPVAKLQAAPPPETRFQELLGQGKVLRDRGDMGNALTKLKEAQALDPRSPMAIAEIAVTYEKMGLVDRANEQWKRIYDMGEGASVYYMAAQGRLKASQEQAMRSVQPVAMKPAESEDTPGNFRQGATFALGDITMDQQQPDASAEEKMLIKVPLIARPQTHIDVKDMVIQVLFYDSLDGKKEVRTNANVSSQWATTPADWNGEDTEVLEVKYERPPPDPKAAAKENRKYAGYIVRVYYKDELQASRAAPPKLGQQFPAPQILEKDASSQ